MTENNNTLPKGITPRSDGRYMGRFTHLGQTYTLYGHSPKKLKIELDDLKYEVTHGIYVKEANITLEAWFSIWLETYKAVTVKAGTIQTYKQVFATLIQAELGKYRLKNIKLAIVQRYINTLFQKGYSKTRINMVYVILLDMYKQAVKNGLVKDNPIQFVDLPKFGTKKEKRVLTLEEQRIFLNYAKFSGYYDFYVVALYTGMRCGEILALEWNDIDLKNNLIKVQGTLVYIRNESRRYKDAPKSKSSYRDIPMLDNVAEILKQRRKNQSEIRLKMGKQWVSDDCLKNPVFTYNTGTVFWDTAIRVDIKKIVKKIQKNHADFDHITPHTFRHTFATRGLEKGIPPKVMQTILGHATLAMTMDLYSHVLPNVKAEEMKKLENII